MDAEAVFEGPREPVLLDLSVASLLDIQSERRGGEMAVAALHQNVRWTFRDLRNRARLIASRLFGKGIQPGDRIVLFAGNCIEFVEIFLAVASLGAIAVLVAPTLAVHEVQDAVMSVEPKLMFVAAQIGYRSNAEFLSWAAKAFEGNVIILGSGNKPATRLPEGCATFDSFLGGSATEHGPTNDAKDPTTSLDGIWSRTPASAPCCFQFTSGTTGPRKASMLSHGNLINNANLVGHRLQLGPSDRVCCSPPLSHCFGLVGGFLASLVHGSGLVIPSEIFNPALALAALRSEGCTIVHAVPSMFDALVKQEQKRVRSGGNSASPADYRLRSGIIAGATPPLDLLRALKTHLGLEKLLYPFGMTELSAVSICTTIQDSLLDDNSSVGTALPHTSIKVIDEEGRTVRVNVPGELCVSGYLVHLGYFHNEAKTREALHVDDTGKLWLRTGDIVMLDETGRCRVVGRSKDMIKKHGENIAPKDIEDALMGHASVKASAVVGVPSEKHGESIVAYVELHDRGPALDERQIKTWLREQGLPPHKMPDAFVAVGDDAAGGLGEFPLNASGKILKTELRRHAGACLLTHY
ncbi:hypothetical protein PG985_011724 [Apiospora marii]|uniref:Uncharacterized protein n=1 Tax=Apiospora marii TaxID=335849 RepID=A0ABR1R0B6_9PEZI